MEWVASLDFEKIANAIIILLTGFLAAFGFRRRGSSEPATAAPGGATVEVAAALVDGTAIKLLAGETAGQTIAVTAQTMAIKDQTKAIEKQTEAIEEAGRAAIEVRDELKEVRNEMRMGRR